MIIKLIYKDHTTILSGIDALNILHNEKEDYVVSICFKDEKPKLDFVLSKYEDNEYINICSAYLMNDKGETIERLN